MKLHSIDEVEGFISSNRLAVLFISSPGCSVCQAFAANRGYLRGNQK
nr:hypothetical protein [Terribacillus saccharophilus]